MADGNEDSTHGLYGLPYMDEGLVYGRRGLNELIVVEAVGEITGISRCEVYFFQLCSKDTAKYQNPGVSQASIIV